MRRSARSADEDPYLVNLSSEERDDVYAGRMLADAAILRAAGQDAAARRAFDEFARRAPPDVASAFTALGAFDLPRQSSPCAASPAGRSVHVRGKQVGGPGGE